LASRGLAGANTTPELQDAAAAEEGGVPPELAKVEQYLKAVEARFTKAGIMTWTDVRYGDPAKEILKAALNCKADIVAMATRSRAGLSRLVFGSVAEQVLRTCDIPVLLITSG